MRGVKVVIILWTCLVVSSKDGSILRPEPDKESRCNKKMIETFGLSGFLTPRKETLPACPGIKLTCCGPTDQFSMLTVWKTKVKPKIESHMGSIRTKMFALKLVLQKLERKDFILLLQKSGLEDVERVKLENNFYAIQDANLDSVLNNFLQSGLTIQTDKVLRLYSSFYCVICDFNSHQFIKVRERKMVFNDDSCRLLVDSTLGFAEELNLRLGLHLQMYSEIMAVLLENEDKLTIPFAEAMAKSMRTCRRSIGFDVPKYESCRSYCRFFNLNTHSPMIEGFPNYFDKFMDQAERFFKKFPGTSRVLEAEGGLLRKTTKSRDFGDWLTTDSGLPEGRALVNSFYFIDPMYIKNKIDFYNEKTSEQGTDEFSTGTMEHHDKTRLEDHSHSFVNYIKTKLEDLDVEYDTETPDKNSIFKTNTNELVPLQSFSSDFNFEGINLRAHVNNKLNASTEKIVGSMKRFSKFPMNFEEVDRQMLKQVNGIENDDVSNFHRDNFLDFTNIGLDLKKQEIEGRNRS